MSIIDEVDEIAEVYFVDREQYERDLKERQRKHLEQVRSSTTQQWRPCMHDECSECYGTGVTRNGGSCVHGISCTCPKCSPA